MYTYIYIYTHIHIHIHTCMHTYIHTYDTHNMQMCIPYLAMHHSYTVSSHSIIHLGIWLYFHQLHVQRQTWMSKENNDCHPSGNICLNK